MDSPVIEAELIHLVREYMALKFTIPEYEGTAIESEQLHAFFAIDKSASMSGGPIKDAKGALISLIQKFRKVGISITIYLFSSKLTELSSDDIGFQEMQAQAEAIKAGGGTLFAPVITAMHEKITSRHYKNVFSVWLTDGQDNKGMAHLVPVLERFKTSMQQEGVAIGVHAIGFSGDHDANLISRISQSGTKPGSFQYVPPNGRIPVAINNVYTLAFESSSWARFISRDVSRKIEIEKVGEDLNGLVYVSEEDLEDAKIEVHKGQQLFQYRLEPRRSETKEFKELVYLVTHFISAKIIQILEVEGSKAGQHLAEIRPLIEEMERRVNYLHQESRTYRTFYRKQCLPYFQTTFDLIQSYYTTLRDNAGVHLSNMQLANLNNLAHKNALKKNLERKIAREVGNNINMINESEALLEELLRNMDKEALRKRYADTVEGYGECLLTTRNWLEALIDGDCFCITLHLERPQNLLGDALEIRVMKVNTTLLTCDGFVESALFETKAGQMIQAERNYQHGEKPLPASSLVKGLPTEIINGIMPIYINEDHWQVARLRIKPMIAWDITVDVLGYIPKQLYNFPFAVFVKAAEDAASEFQEFQMGLVRDTCQAIYNDNRESMKKFLKNQLDAYLSTPESRLPEFVPSNSIFVAQLFCMRRAGDADAVEQIFPQLVEEEFRRKILKKEVDLHDFAIKVLGIDMTEHFEQVKSSLQTGQKYGGMFKKETRTDSGETPKPAEAFSFKGRIQALTEKAAHFIDKINQHLAKGGVMYRVVSAIRLFGLKIATLDDIGLVTPEQKLALIFQTLRDKRNLNRKEAFASGKYVNIFDQESALLFIQEVYTETVSRETLSYKAKILSQMQGAEYGARAFTFATTRDIDEAAGCLYGAKQGSTEFCLFYIQLKSPVAELVGQKLKLLNRGEHKGVTLVVDKLKTGGSVRWVPSNKVFNTIWKQHQHKVPEQEWIEAVPQRAEHIQHKYLRVAGVFVPYRKPRSNVKDARHWEGKAKAPPTAAKKNLKKVRKVGNARRGKKW